MSHTSSTKYAATYTAYHELTNVSVSLARLLKLVQVNVCVIGFFPASQRMSNSLHFCKWKIRDTILIPVSSNSSSEDRPYKYKTSGWLRCDVDRLLSSFWPASYIGDLRIQSVLATKCNQIDILGYRNLGALACIVLMAIYLNSLDLELKTVLTPSQLTVFFLL